MNLFDIIEIEKDREAEECTHSHEEKTETIWPGETTPRWTWTCIVCGKVRGRFQK